ncbi:MAG: 4Fe-4S dicluster domain-containing protein, partial [Planctomycetota bacterium]|nr:4Fe-4S dicluster domain-containing protein [Planctomycetota bacterium]
KGCGLCIDVCPNKCLAFSKQLNLRGVSPPEVISPQNCTGCAFCALMCPDWAITVYRILKEKEVEAK